MEDGRVYCLLASTTRYQGGRPIQVADFIDVDVVEQALEKPRGYFSWNRALRGAFDRGQRDAAAGRSPKDCPYNDARKDDGRLTWSRGFRTAWFDGYAYTPKVDPNQG